MKKYQREVIELRCYYPDLPHKHSFGFEFVGGRVFHSPKELNWCGIGYEEFIKRVIEKFGYCWKLIFRYFDGENWVEGYSSVNWK
jgi:hypothetical protein